MDWTKAKTILIIALIITDIFLIATYVQKDDNGELRNEKALLSVLEENQIFIGIERIPEKHEDMPTLSAEYRSVTQEEVEALIESTDFSSGRKYGGGVYCSGGGVCKLSWAHEFLCRGKHSKTA